MIEWKIETRKINELAPNPKNPRTLSKHDAQQLRTSMEKFGLIDKPIINTDGQIIGGHQRIKTLKAMGHKKVEVYVPVTTLTPQQVDELNIRLNRNTGEWDYDMLANEYEIGDLVYYGFTTEQLVSLPTLDDPEASEGAAQEKLCETCGQKIKNKRI